MGEIIIKGQTNVAPNKSYESNVWQCPSDITQDFWVRLDLPIEDLQNEALQVTCKSWLSDDGENWNPYHGGVFNGGATLTKSGAIATGFNFKCSYDRVAGKYVKATMESTERVKITMLVETVD